MVIKEKTILNFSLLSEQSRKMLRLSKMKISESAFQNSRKKAELGFLKRRYGRKQDAGASQSGFFKKVWPRKSSGELPSPPSRQRKKEEEAPTGGPAWCIKSLSL